MQWAVPEYSRPEVDYAGRELITAPSNSYQFDKALGVIDNFRASHHFPLNTFQTTLRHKVKQYADSVVAQRIKRLRAIQFKLQRHTKNPIALSAMQDIGGCRAILKNTSQVRKLREAYLRSDLKHELVGEDDYITSPKSSGYRGIHLIYRYKSDKKDTYNGLQIEVQLRSQFQHAWATAVEMVGFFRREMLKSGHGDYVWKHFFKLMASEIAIEEDAPFGIPGIPTDRSKLRDQLCRCAEKLGALAYLRAVGAGISDVTEVDTSGAHYFILELSILDKRLKITGYKLSARSRATMAYSEVERALFGSSNHDAVLISAESMVDLRRAYINYFLDMHRFIQMVELAMKQ